MIQTKYGTFDGDSWEELCQLVFKLKYYDKNYQEMVASPGDFGIEGFTKVDGIAFQCYCPDQHYTQKELYEKQRDKITKDLNKLKKYESEIKSRIGKTTIKKWVFLTPIITDNELLKHAQTKEDEVLGWNLSIIDPDFKVILRDAEFYATEISQIQNSQGKKITLFSVLDIADNSVDNEITVYEANIIRKNKARCMFGGKLDEKKHLKLNKITSKKWTDGDFLFKEIEKNASEVYFQLMRVINQYESEVEELCITWQGDAENLVSKVRDELGARIEEAIPALGEAERYRVADQMTSKWLALCPLDIEL